MGLLRVMATAATVASAYSFDIPLRLVIGIDIAVLGLLIDRKLYCKTTQSKKTGREFKMVLLVQLALQ